MPKVNHIRSSLSLQKQARKVRLTPPQRAVVQRKAETKRLLNTFRQKTDEYKRINEIIAFKFKGVKTKYAKHEILQGLLVECDKDIKRINQVLDGVPKNQKVLGEELEKVQALKKLKKEADFARTEIALRINKLYPSYY